MNNSSCPHSHQGIGSNNNNGKNIQNYAFLNEGDKYMLRTILNLINQIIEKVAELFSYCAKFLMHAEYLNI